MKVEVEDERVLFIAESKTEFDALMKLVGTDPIEVRMWCTNELMLAKKKAPRLSKDEEQAGIVARYHQALMKEGIRDWDIVAHLTEKFQEQLLANHFGRKNGSVCQ